MSGSGKTYWSELLSKKYNFKHIEFDQLIGRSKDIANLIKKFPGKDEAEKLGNYFGKPWDINFLSKEKRFLAIEKKFMDKRFRTS